MYRFVVISLLNAFTAIWGQAQVLHVVDEQEMPVAYAQVTCFTSEGHSVTKLTDSIGTARFPNLADAFQGEGKVEVRHIAFVPFRAALAARGTQTLQLTPADNALQQVVITAQYGLRKGQDAVHKVKVIDRKQIEAQAAVTLRDVLRNEVNMRVQRDNILGSGLNLQGLGGQNIKILIDGVPMIGRQNGNIDLEQINLNNIERIEIVEGPMSIAYGTDALAGAINLITRKSGPKTGPYLSLNSYYESAGQYNLDGSLGASKGKHQVSLNGGRNYFDGWSSADPFFQFPKVRPADSLRAKSWNPKLQHFARLQYQYKAAKFSLQPYAEYFDEIITNRGMPRAPYGEFAFDDTYRTWRTNAGLQATGKIKKGNQVRIVAAANDFRRIKNTFYNNLTTLAQQLTVNVEDQDTSRFRLLMSRGVFSHALPGEKISYQVGYDIGHENAYGKRIEDDFQAQTDMALFGSAEATLGQRLVVRPGLRIAYNTAYPAPLAPSINLKYQVPMRDRQRHTLVLRSSWARGFRAPSLKELYFEFVDINHNILGNPELQAEYSHNFQLNASWQQVQATSIARIELGGYFNQVRNLISLAQSVAGPEFVYLNIGKAQTLGVQARTSWQWERWNFDIAGAWIGRSNALFDGEDVPAFSFAPEVRGQLRYRWPKLNMQLASFYKFTGAVPGFANIDGELVPTTIGAYHMLDLNVSKGFFGHRLTWTVGGKNLLDVRNINATSAPTGAHGGGSNSQPVSWGRTLFSALRINLN